MLRRPPISTRTDTLFPYTTLFRSSDGVLGACEAVDHQLLDGRPVRVGDGLHDDDTVGRVVRGTDGFVEFFRLLLLVVTELAEKLATNLLQAGDVVIQLLASCQLRLECLQSPLRVYVLVGL